MKLFSLVDAVLGLFLDFLVTCPHQPLKMQFVLQPNIAEISAVAEAASTSAGSPGESEDGEGLSTYRVSVCESTQGLDSVCTKFLASGCTKF